MSRGLSGDSLGGSATVQVVSHGPGEASAGAQPACAGGFVPFLTPSDTPAEITSVRATAETVSYRSSTDFYPAGRGSACPFPKRRFGAGETQIRRPRTVVPNCGWPRRADRVLRRIRPGPVSTVVRQRVPPVPRRSCRYGRPGQNPTRPGRHGLPAPSATRRPIRFRCPPPTEIIGALPRRGRFNQIVCLIRISQSCCGNRRTVIFGAATTGGPRRPGWCGPVPNEMQGGLMSKFRGISHGSTERRKMRVRRPSRWFLTGGLWREPWWPGRPACPASPPPGRQRMVTGTATTAR